MYLDAQGNVIEDASIVGYKAIGVPGSVAGMVYAEKKVWKAVPGEGDGSGDQVGRGRIRPGCRGRAETYRKTSLLARFPSRGASSSGMETTTRRARYFQQPDLARTLKRIASNPDDFYHGAMARELAAAMQKGGGLITAEDLANYEVKEREAVRGTYRGYEIISAPPPSSGGITMIEVLNILEGYDLGKQGGRSAQAVHLTVEAFRRAFFDRSEFLGDPDFSKIPVAQLIDKRYGAAWRESIDPAHATASKDLRRPAIFSELEQYAEAASSSQASPRSNHTTHYSVVDTDGNAVAVTTTLNDSFGSRVTAEGLGFLLNDEMDDFASKQGVPNMFGLIQGPANAIGPGKRPLSAMAPTIVLKDGKLFLVLGSPGGPRIISTVTNILMGVVDYGMNIQEAVNAPRFHHQWLPDVVSVEQGFPPDYGQAAGGDGHNGSKARETYWSDGECIMIDPKTGERLGASDKRNNGRAMGF